MIHQVKTEDNQRDTVRFGSSEITYTITRSRRRKKTIAITVDYDAGVRVTAPTRTSVKHIRQVVLKRADWILHKASEEVQSPPRRELVSGESLLFLGSEPGLFVEQVGVHRVTVKFDDCSFRVTVPAPLDGEKRRAAIESALVVWYKATAVEHLAQRVECWERAVGLTPTRILVRDQRRRWGSCSADGTLRFNWRLIMAPPTLIDYVVVHELSHLCVRNHSAAFWAKVATVLPDYKVRRSDLKEMEPRLTI